MRRVLVSLTSEGRCQALSRGHYSGSTGTRACSGTRLFPVAGSTSGMRGTSRPMRLGLPVSFPMAIYNQENTITAEPDLIVTEILALPSNSSRNKIIAIP